jgi:hypothetical protein
VAVTWGRQEITANGELFTPRAGGEASETLVSCRLLETVEFIVKVEIVEWERKLRNRTEAASPCAGVHFYVNVRALIALCACVK